MAGGYHIGQCHSGGVCFEHKLFRTLLFKLHIKPILLGLISMARNKQLPYISGPSTPFPPCSATSKLTHILRVIHELSIGNVQCHIPPRPHCLNTLPTLPRLPSSSTKQLPFLVPPWPPLPKVCCY